MDKEDYQKLIENITPKENKLLNMFISFFVGGLIGMLGLFIYNKMINVYNRELSISFMLLILIFIASLLTSIGIGDNLFSRFRCGLIIPITGFAHSITSSIIDYKKEGLINMGSNTFKLAGSVLLYGIVSSIILTIIKVIINV